MYFILHHDDQQIPSQLLWASDISSADLQKTEITECQHVPSSKGSVGIPFAKQPRTFFLVQVDAQVDEAPQQDQEEKAAGDSSCESCDGGSTQPFT